MYNWWKYLAQYWKLPSPNKCTSWHIYFRLVSVVNITVLLSLSVVCIISSLWQLNNLYSDKISMVSYLDFGSLGWVFLRCLYIVCLTEVISWSKILAGLVFCISLIIILDGLSLGSSVAFLLQPCLIRWRSTLLVSISP